MKIFIIVFSSSSDVKVTATIDGTDVFECRRASLGQPLFVAEWDPSRYDDRRVHSFRVDVKHSNVENSNIETANDETSNDEMSNESRTFQFGLGQKENFIDGGDVTGDFSFLAR